EDEARMRSFAGATGIQPSQMRAAARQDGFLAGVLEHILDHESLLVAFADSAGIDPAEIARARAALGRGADWGRDLPWAPSAATALRMRSHKRHAAGLAVRHVSPAMPSSPCCRSRTSTATPSTPRSKSATTPRLPRRR